MTDIFNWNTLDVEISFEIISNFTQLQYSGSHSKTSKCRQSLHIILKEMQ
jgi:hypothetical protein